MSMVDDIDAYLIKDKGEEEVKEALKRFIRRAVIPLSLMDLQSFDILPRDLDVLEHVMEKANEANEHFGKEMMDPCGLVKIGNLHYIKKEYHEANELYLRALEMGELLPARKNLGIGLLAEGKVESALEALEVALKRFDKDHEIWFYLGLAWEQYAHEAEHLDVLERNKRMTEALDHYSKSLELEPSFGPARYSKGMALTFLGRKKEAQELITEVLQDDPASEAAWIAKGLLLRSSEDIRGALKCYENAITINQDSHLAWLNKSVALFGLERFEDSLESASRAIELNETSEIAWSNKGAVLCEMSRFKEALECFDKALEINADFEGASRNREKALKAIEDGRDTSAE